MREASTARSTASPVAEAIGRLANELLDRWEPALRGATWVRRLMLLGAVHEQLQEDIEDMETYCAVSPVFIAGLIDRFGADKVTSLEQAHIYSNSGSEAHRQLACQWFAEQRND
jgi:hypothetical protein